nr:RDD family protein [Helicobacter cetorum]
MRNATKNTSQLSLKGLGITLRLKAFITDIFMIYTPMLYIMTYIILGSAKSFRENQSAIFLCLVFYALTHSLFIAFKTQSPGMRYANFRLIKNNGEKVGFFLALWRFILWVFSMGLLIGFIAPFIFKFFLHDKLSGTHIEVEPQ